MNGSLREVMLTERLLSGRYKFMFHVTLLFAILVAAIISYKLAMLEDKKPMLMLDNITPPLTSPTGLVKSRV